MIYTHATKSRGRGATKPRGGERLLDSPCSCSSDRPSVRRRWPDDKLNYFHWISTLFGICITWVKNGWDGIEYERRITLNMHIMAGHVT